MRCKFFGIFEKTNLSVSFFERKKNRIWIVETWFKEKVKMRKDLGKDDF